MRWQEAVDRNSVNHMPEPPDSHSQPPSNSRLTEAADHGVVDRADLLSRLRHEIHHSIGGTSGLDRQDRLLKAWHEHDGAHDAHDAHEKNSLDDLPGGVPSHVGAFHGSMASCESSGSDLAPERLSTGWLGLLEDGSDDSGVSIDARMDGGLLRHGIHEWIGDPYQTPRITATSDSNIDRARLVPSSDWVPPFGPVISLLHRLRVSHDSMGRPAPRIVWIGHRCLPAPWNLLGGRRPAAFDVEACFRARDELKPSFQERLEEEASEIDGRLLEHSLFVTPPQDDRQARRWCLEQAVRTVSIDAVVIDGSGFAPLDSRRLHVAVAERSRRGESPLLVLMVRPPRDRLTRSSAITRWSVVPSAKDCRGDHRIAAWSVRLLRARMPQSPPSQGKAVIGLVHADWDLPSVASPKTAGSILSSSNFSPTSSPNFSSTSSSTSSSMSPSNRSISLVEKEPHVDTPSCDSIPMAGHGSGPPSTKSSSGWPIGHDRSGLFEEEINIPGDRPRGHSGRRGRRGIRRGSTGSGGWNASRFSTGDRLLFTGESAGDPQGDDARGGASDGNVGDRGKMANVPEGR